MGWQPPRAISRPWHVPGKVLPVPLGLGRRADVRVPLLEPRWFAADPSVRKSG